MGAEESIRNTEFIRDEELKEIVEEIYRKHPLPKDFTKILEDVGRNTKGRWGGEQLCRCLTVLIREGKLALTIAVPPDMNSYTMFLPALRIS